MEQGHVLSDPVTHQANNSTSFLTLYVNARTAIKKKKTFIMHCRVQSAPTPMVGPGGRKEKTKRPPQALGRAYLQKWKAKRGLQGLPGLDGVGLRLLGVRLKVKIMSFRVGEMMAVKIAELIEGAVFPWGQNQPQHAYQHHWGMI